MDTLQDGDEAPFQKKGLFSYICLPGNCLVLWSGWCSQLILIVFEAFIFIYCMMALLLQYLHLYKSVWWLPHSYNSYAMVRHQPIGAVANKFFFVLFQSQVRGRKELSFMIKQNVFQFSLFNSVFHTFLECTFYWSMLNKHRLFSLLYNGCCLVTIALIFGSLEWSKTLATKPFWILVIFFFPTYRISTWSTNSWSCFVAWCWFDVWCGLWSNGSFWQWRPQHGPKVSLS